MRNKTIFLNDFISTHNFDLFSISETWLGCEATNDRHANSILPDGYMMHHVDRNSERGGGGIASIYKMWLEVRPNKRLKFTQFEPVMVVRQRGVNTYAVELPPFA